MTLKFKRIITVDFTLLFRAALRSSLGSWVLDYEVANYVANLDNHLANFESKLPTSVAPNFASLTTRVCRTVWRFLQSWR